MTVNPGSIPSPPDLELEELCTNAQARAAGIPDVPLLCTSHRALVTRRRQFQFARSERLRPRRTRRTVVEGAQTRGVGWACVVLCSAYAPRVCRWAANTKRRKQLVSQPSPRPHTQRLTCCLPVCLPRPTGRPCGRRKTRSRSPHTTHRTCSAPTHHVRG